MAMNRSKRLTQPVRKISRDVKLGEKRMPGERKYIVDIASSKGGGRQVLFASSPIEAANRAMINQFVKASTFPKKRSVIVTDTTKKKDAQSFFGD